MIYWPYLVQGGIMILTFSLPAKEVWWAWPLRILSAVIALWIAAIMTRNNRSDAELRNRIKMQKTNGTGSNAKTNGY